MLPIAEDCVANEEPFRRQQGYRSNRILAEIVGWVEAHSADTHRRTMGTAESILSLAEGLNPSYAESRRSALHKWHLLSLMKSLGIE
jgi:hypothetical protein